MSLHESNRGSLVVKSLSNVPFQKSESSKTNNKIQSVQKGTKYTTSPEKSCFSYSLSSHVHCLEASLGHPSLKTIGPPLLISSCHFCIYEINVVLFQHERLFPKRRWASEALVLGFFWWARKGGK